MASDELQATIEQVEAKRRELTSATGRTIAGDGAGRAALRLLHVGLVYR